MHEAPHHQASGLDSLARARSARLVAMVNLGDEDAELPLLWRLCLSLANLGYPVTVLDAGQAESADNPGLAQLLDCPHRKGDDNPDAAAWSVLPAATGLRSLYPMADGPNRLTTRLANLFADDGVVIVYGKVDTLLGLLPGQPLQPLLVVSSTPESLLTSYQAFKRLLGAGYLAPLVVDAQPPAADPRSYDGAGAGPALADCARNFLGIELKWIRLQTSQDDSAPGSDLQRMSLRILENALALSHRWTHIAPTGTKMNAGYFSRSH